MAVLTSKLERPPYVHNFVRYLHQDVPSTVKALVDFAINNPRRTYATGNAAVRDRLLLGIDRPTALKMVAAHGHADSRVMNKEYVEAFFDFDEGRKLSRRLSFDQLVEPFRVSRTVVVPVKPLAVCSESGKLKAMFSVGWQSMPLTQHQWRVLMTMIEDAVFTLTDFEKADGEFYAFPRQKKTDPKSRAPMLARRGEIELLSKADLKEQLEIYLTALDIAKRILGQMNSEEKSEGKKPTTDPNQPDLFP